MTKIQVFFIHKEFVFEKIFDVSSVPVIGSDMMTRANPDGGHVGGEVKNVRHYMDEDFVQITCHVSLRCLCTLHVFNMGWLSHDANGFIKDPKSTSRNK